MNMSYCRFHNTLQDLRDCYYNIWDTEDMSDEEKRAREQLIELCCDIAEQRDELLEEDTSEDEE